MNCCSRHYRFLAILALAVVIEGKLLHCTAEDGAITADLCRVSREQPAQSSAPAAPDCGDESGCICRGATLTAVFVPEAADSCESCVVFIDAADGRTTVASPFAAESPARTASQPFGRRLRALLATFVI